MRRLVDLEGELPWWAVFDGRLDELEVALAQEAADLEHIRTQAVDLLTEVQRRRATMTATLEELRGSSHPDERDRYRRVSHALKLSGRQALRVQGLLSKVKTQIRARNIQQNNVWASEPNEESASDIEQLRRHWVRMGKVMGWLP